MTRKRKRLIKEFDSVIENLEKAGIKHNDDYDIVGVGDVVESVLKRLGITEDRVKEYFGTDECGCTERKKYLNGIFYWRQKAKERKGDGF